MPSPAQSIAALACPRDYEVLRSKLECLSGFGRDENSGNVRFTDDVPARVRTQVSDCLLCHVVNISHVVLEAGDAPPETERVRKSRGALPVECRCHCAMSLHGFQLFGAEVLLRIELGDLTVKRSQSLAQLLRRCLSADRDRARVIEGVVVDSHCLPKPTVDELLLKLGARIVEHIREHISCIGGLRVLSDTRPLPLHLDGYCA